MRLIDANRLEDTWNQFLSMIDNVEAQPTVDPVKHAHWIRKSKASGWWKCSNCNCTIWSEHEEDRTEFHRYCGRCGCRMDEVPNDNQDILE